MSYRRIWNAALVSAGAIGAIALTAVVGIAVAGGQLAGAAPQAVPAGSLGIGARTVAPLSEPISADSRVPGADGATAKPAALLKVVQQKDAPVPKKSKVAAKRSATRSTSSASRPSGSKSSRGISGSGWQSARVSWYGPGFYGNTMAGGGALKRDSMVVAHRSLRFGTRVQFSYNGRTCTAVVMDRGPFVGGRVFDLGPGTARALGFSGVGMVKYRILGR